jgi:hypothetical protein
VLQIICSLSNTICHVSEHLKQKKTNPFCLLLRINNSGTFIAVKEVQSVLKDFSIRLERNNPLKYFKKHIMCGGRNGNGPKNKKEKMAA